MRFTLNLNAFTILFFFFLLSANGISQDDASRSEDETIIHFIELSFDPVLPLYSFKERLDKNLSGFSLAYLRQRNPKRLDYFGIQFSYVHIGSLSNTFYEFEEKTSTELMSLKFLYRFFPDFYFWKIEPFIEASLGPQLIYTGTTTNYYSDDSGNFNFEDEDLGISYGAGIGFTLHIYNQSFLLFKYSMVSGNAMSYYIPGELDSGLPFDSFHYESSAIIYQNWQIGVTVTF